MKTGTLKTYKFNLFKDNEITTVEVEAADYQDAEKELFLAGYSLQFGEWLIHNFTIEGRGNQGER